MLARTVVAAALVAVATFAAALPAAAQVTPTYSGLAYATLDGVPLLLDLYIPPVGASPRPCVLWIHGGGWQGGTRVGIPSGAVRLLQRGIAVASVDYRLTSQAGQFGSFPVIFPAQIEDVKGAARWLRAHAGDYGLDPARFGSWGSSAGGHLSALLGTSGGVVPLEGATGGNLALSSAVQAFADYFGPTDLLHMTDMVTTPPGSTLDHDAYNSPESHLIGWDDPGQGLGDVKANQANPDPPYPALLQLLGLVNPITHLDASDPPGFIAHGTDDTTVPMGQSVVLYEAMQAAGVTSRFRPVSGAGHGFLGNATDSLVVEFFRGVFFPGVASVAAASADDRVSAHPNPARGNVTLVRSAGFGSGEVLDVIDLAGRRVRRLVPERGTSRVEWDGRDEAGRAVRSGLYVIRTTGGSQLRVTLLD